MVTMAERIVKIETQMTGVRDDISEIKNLLTKHIESESQKYESFDKKYSNKWVETATVGIIISVVGAIVYGLIQLL